MPTKETQRTVEAWRLATFGPMPSIDKLAVRANQEMGELLQACAFGASVERIAEETADVVIVLYGLASSYGIDLRSDLRLSGYVTMVERTPKNTPLERAAYANKQMAILVGKAVFGETDLRHAISLCVVDLLILARDAGFDVWEAVDRKMAINRTREWEPSPDGVGYHVRTR